MPATPGPTSHIYMSQRLRLHYVDWGNPEAPPLLLVHGGRDHCRNWDWVAEALRHDYHIIAPDLRGHGDSEWLKGSVYRLSDYVYDIAQLIRQTDLAPLTVIGHSLGGAVSVHYAGTYPDKVRRLVAIEGLGMAPHRVEEAEAKHAGEVLREWIPQMRELSGRLPRRYASLDEAFARMYEANRHLTEAQARHLTMHGVSQNEDGTYSWKFDNYVRADRPFGMTFEQTKQIWAAITCPTLLVYGRESWASDPEQDGRIAHFRNARVSRFAGAGHWVHHDKLEQFLSEVRAFLAA